MKAPKKAAKKAQKAPPRLLWRTPALFALVAPFLFMILDISLEQASQSDGFSPLKLWNWLVADGLFIPRAVYLAGLLPAAFAGLLIARRDQRGGATLGFALALFVLLGIPIGIVFARNLFLFPPPALSAQFLIVGRVVASVVISGLVCYALSRWAKPERR